MMYKLAVLVVDDVVVVVAASAVCGYSFRQDADDE
jgi:hypothetical protein